MAENLGDTTIPGGQALDLNALIGGSTIEDVEVDFVRDEEGEKVMPVKFEASKPTNIQMSFVLLYSSSSYYTSIPLRMLNTSMTLRCAVRARNRVRPRIRGRPRFCAPNAHRRARVREVPCANSSKNAHMSRNRVDKNGS